MGNAVAGDLTTALRQRIAVEGRLDHGPEEVERDGAGAALGEHAAEASFAGADIEDELAVQVAALFQHDGVEEQCAAGVAFVDEADVLGGEGLPSAGVVFFSIRIWSGKKGGHYARVAKAGDRRRSEIRWQVTLDLQAGTFPSSELS